MDNLDYTLAMAVVIYIAIKNHEIKNELQAVIPVRDVINIDAEIALALPRTS